MNIGHKELLNLFNTQFTDMLRDLTRVFPDDEDFTFFNSAGPLLISTDRAAVSRLFHNNVAKQYGDQILARNDAFLLEVDYSRYTYDDWSNMLVSKLKNCWRSLSEENRDIIWKYLQILMKLDARIHVN